MPLFSKFYRAPTLEEDQANLDEIAKVGALGIMLTVDTQSYGSRLRGLRYGFDATYVSSRPASLTNFPLINGS